MKNLKKYIKLIALTVFILPLAILLSACGGKTDGNPDDSLLRFENIIFESQTIDYSGNENAIFINGILPEGANVAYVNNKATNAGEYNAKATISLEGYKTLQLTAKLIINKINYDMSSASWDYDSTTTYIYNGSEYQVEAINLPQGVTAKQYQSNRQTDAGNYTASVTFNYDMINYNAPTIPNLNWEIEKANIAGIIFNSRIVEYDSLEHSINLVGNVPANSTTRITYNNQEITGVSEVGSYIVKLIIINPNYNTYESTVTLKITSTEERLYSVVFNGKLYLQNNLDSNKLYSYDGTDFEKVNNDRAEYLTIVENKLYYYSSSLFSKVIKSYNGIIASNLLEINGEYLTSDETYIYYAINNLLNTSKNGIYKIKLDGSEEATRLVKDKAEYLTYYNDKIYYANVNHGRYLYEISVNANDQETGIPLYEEKVSDIILDNGVLYFNSTKITLGVPVASAIRNYTISNGTSIKLTTDNGAYLTKVGNYIYYINKDKITSLLFGDGVYRVNISQDKDSNLPGIKVLSSEDNGYSSLSSNGNYLYYYKLNDKHIYSYNLSTKQEIDIMASFIVEEEEIAPSGYAHLSQYNGEIYYTNPLDSGSLYKYNINTKAHYKVLANNVSNVYFNNGYMYYSTYILANYALWKMDLETNESVKISSNRTDNLIFDGNIIYYIKVGSFYNNYIMKMGLNGEEPTEIYSDKNLWVASFEKVGNDIYFTINPSFGNKYVYKYNIITNTGESLDLRSNYMTVSSDGTMYYYNLANNTINSYNLTTEQDNVLVSNVNINNMIVADGYLYYSSTKSGNIGLFKYNLTNKDNLELSDKCADGMINMNGKIYFIQTAISYMNDYPNNSNGDGQLYCYDGASITRL